MINFLFKNKIILVLVIFTYFFIPQISNASNVYLKSMNSVLSPESEFKVDVLINSEVAVNAVDLQIYYPLDKLKFLDFNNANSIVDLWQGGPEVLKNGHIKLTGAILHSFKGNSGQIISIMFKALNSGNVDISFERTDLYLADGKGTKILANSSSFSMAVNESAPKIISSIQDVSIKDYTPPDIFLGISQDSFGTNSLVVFNAVDKESGIKSTQIRFKKWLIWSEWQIAQNPVLYPSGVWKIQVKAENNSNLMTTKTLFLSNKFFQKLSVVIVGFLFVFLFFALYNKYKRKY